MRMGKVKILGGMLSRAPLTVPTLTELGMPALCAAAHSLVQDKGMTTTLLVMQMAKRGNRARPLRVDAPDSPQVITLVLETLFVLIEGSFVRRVLESYSTNSWGLKPAEPHLILLTYCI